MTVLYKYGLLTGTEYQREVRILYLVFLLPILGGSGLKDKKVKCVLMLVVYMSVVLCATSSSGT